MTTSDARTKAKRRLGIDLSDTQFDAEIDDYVVDAVDRLWPQGAQEVAPQTVALVVDAYGQATVDLAALSTPLDDVRKAEVSEGYQPYPADRISTHGTILTLRQLSTSVNQGFLYGLKKLTLSTCPTELNMAVIYFTMSDFYNNNAGEKSKYNEYMQNGRGAVDGMEGLAIDYEQKAKAILEDKATLYGHQ
jgi:hypothetical protein